jgi:hypothetical protein
VALVVGCDEHSDGSIRVLPFPSAIHSRRWWLFGCSQIRTAVEAVQAALVSHDPALKPCIVSSQKLHLTVRALFSVSEIESKGKIPLLLIDGRRGGAADLWIIGPIRRRAQSATLHLYVLLVSCCLPDGGLPVVCVAALCAPPERPRRRASGEAAAQAGPGGATGTWPAHASISPVVDLRRAVWWFFA